VSAHLRYLRFVIRHKWFVLVAGLRVGGIPLWRLLIHDWSKFGPAEWGPYVRNFYGPKLVASYGDARHHGGLSPAEVERMKATRRAAFDRAWLHHQHANPHHWQHWVLREDAGATKALRMPDQFAREMVADWMGAGRAITGRWEAREWYEKNGGPMILNMHTRTLVERLLGVPCYCGARGGSRLACSAFGYCEAHTVPVEAAGGPALPTAEGFRVRGEYPDPETVWSLASTPPGRADGEGER
jgi:hypothetical protein